MRTPVPQLPRRSLRADPRRRHARHGVRERYRHPRAPPPARHEALVLSQRRRRRQRSVAVLRFGVDDGRRRPGGGPAASSEKGTVHVAHRGPAAGQGQRPDRAGGTGRIRTGNRRRRVRAEVSSARRSRAEVGWWARFPSGLRRRVSDAVEPTRDAVTVHLPRPANDGSYLDRAIGGVASVATAASGGGAGGVMMNNAARGDWPDRGGVRASGRIRAREVRGVAVNADGCCASTPRITRPARWRWSGSAASTITTGAVFRVCAAGGDGAGSGGDGGGAAVPGGARWLGGGRRGARGRARGGSERER